MLASYRNAVLCIVFILPHTFIYLGEGLDAVTGQCSPGYYCPGGQDSYTPPGYECWMGHYCTNGSVIPQPCEEGYTQLQTTQDSCHLCPEGYFCDPNEGTT